MQSARVRGFWKGRVMENIYTECVGRNKNNFNEQLVVHFFLKEFKPFFIIKKLINLTNIKGVSYNSRTW